MLHSLELAQGGMPLARLQLRLPTQEGEISYLSQQGKKLKKPLAYQPITLEKEGLKGTPKLGNL